MPPTWKGVQSGETKRSEVRPGPAPCIPSRDKQSSGRKDIEWPMNHGQTLLHFPHPPRAGKIADNQGRPGKKTIWMADKSGPNE